MDHSNQPKMAADIFIDEKLISDLQQSGKVLRWSKKAFENMPESEVRKLLKKTGKEWLSVRLHITDMLRKLAREFDQVHKDVHISKTVGSSVAIVGGGLAIGGFIASFFTFGAAAIVSIVGAAIAGTGGVTTFGASLGEFFQTRKFKKKQRELFETDKLLVEQMMALIKLLPESNEPDIKHGEAQEISSAEQVFTTVKGTTNAGNSVLGITKMVVTLAGEVGDDVAGTVFKASGAAVRGLHIVGGVFSIIMLPLDMYTLVTSSVTLAKNESANLSRVFTELADELEDNMFEVEDVLRQHNI